MNDVDLSKSGSRAQRHAGLAGQLVFADVAASRAAHGGRLARFSHRANNTLEEAQDLRVLISERQWRKVLLVTSNYHTRRARYIFRKTLPGEVSLEVAGAASPDFEPGSWWQSRQGRKTFFLETMGYLDAVWELHEHQTGSTGAS